MDNDIKVPNFDQKIFSYDGDIWEAIVEWEGAEAGEDLRRTSDAVDSAIKEVMRKYAAEAVRLNEPTESDKTPFNLEAAMRGEPIVTRDGRQAKFVAYEPGSESYSVVSLIDGEIQTHNEQGLFFNDGSECEDDLFMATKTIWLNIYLSDDGSWISSSAHRSKDSAEKSADNLWDGEKYIAVPVKLK